MQRLITPNRYIIPIDINQGLAHIWMRPPTDEELETLPHEFLTGDKDWDPSIFDHIESEDSQWYSTESDFGETTDLEPQKGKANVTCFGNADTKQVNY